MKDFILIMVLVTLVGGACLYIRNHSKKGIKCVGCPFASGCGYKCTHAAIAAHQKEKAAYE